MGTDREMSITDARAKFADVIYAAMVEGKTTYLTNHGRRVAVIAPISAVKTSQPGREATRDDRT